MVEVKVEVMEARGNYKRLLQAFGVPVIEDIERLQAVVMKMSIEERKTQHKEVRQVIQDARDMLGQKALSLEQGLADNHRSILSIARGMNLTFRNTLRPKYAKGAILLLSFQDTERFLLHKDSLDDKLARLRKGLIVYLSEYAALVMECLRSGRPSRDLEPIKFPNPVACWDLQSHARSSVATRQTRSTGHYPRRPDWPQGKAARKCRFKLFNFKVPPEGTAESDSGSERAASQDLNAEMESRGTRDIDSGSDEASSLELKSMPAVKINLTSTKKSTEFADGCADNFVRVLGELKVLFEEYGVVNFMELEGLAADGPKELRREFARVASEAIDNLRMELTVEEPGAPSNKSKVGPQKATREAAESAFKDFKALLKSKITSKGLKGDKTDPEAAIADKVKQVLEQFQTLLDVSRDQLLKLSEEAWQRREQAHQAAKSQSPKERLSSSRDSLFLEEDERPRKNKERRPPSPPMRVIRELSIDDRRNRKGGRSRHITDPGRFGNNRRRGGEFGKNL